MSRTVTVAGFVALAMLLLAVEIVAWRTRRVARLSTVLARLLGRRAAWLTVLACWLWVGWHLFVRVGR